MSQESTRQVGAMYEPRGWAGCYHCLHDFSDVEGLSLLSFRPKGDVCVCCSSVGNTFLFSSQNDNIRFITTYTGV